MKTSQHCWCTSLIVLKDETFRVMNTLLDITPHMIVLSFSIFIPNKLYLISLPHQSYQELKLCTTLHKII